MTSQAYISARNGLRDAMMLWMAGKLDATTAGELVNVCMERMMALLGGQDEE